MSISGMMLSVHSAHANFVLPHQTQREARPVRIVATNVYLRTAAGWRMIVHHASPAPAEKPPAVAEPPPPKFLH